MKDDNGKEIELNRHGKPKGKPGRPKGAGVGTKRLLPMKRLFVENYFKCHCNGTAAAALTYNDNKDSRCNTNRAHQLLKRPEVRAEVNRILEDRGLTGTNVKREIVDLAFMQPGDSWTEIPGAVGMKTKALTMAAQITGVVDVDGAVKAQAPLIQLLIENPDKQPIVSVCGVSPEEPEEVEEVINPIDSDKAE